MSVLRNNLKGIPQSPKWHSEGDVFTHTRLVRQALDPAITQYMSFQPLVAVFGPITPEDRRILRIAAWLHDVGKAEKTAWTHPDGSQSPLSQYQAQGLTVQQMMAPDFGEPGGRWQAIGHEDPEAYQSGIQGPWQQIVNNLSPEDQELLHFLIQKHMSFGSEGLHKSVLNQMLDSKGNIIPDRKFKLLMIIKQMDVMGRKGGDPRESILQLVSDNIQEKQQSVERRKVASGPQDRESFIQWARQKRDSQGQPFTQERIDQMVRGRFGD